MASLANSAPSTTLTPTCNIVTPVGMLGYGLHFDQTAAALTEKKANGAPTAIILDSGSTDSGPERLALGCLGVPRESYKRDLEKLIKLAWGFEVPLMFSSAGGDGSDEHVREMGDVVREICGDPGNEHYRLKVISIFSCIPKTLVSERLQDGMISGCGKPVPVLTQRAVDATPRIVAQMGPEPIFDAMLKNPDFNVLIAGRAYDPAPYIAYAAFASKTILKGACSPEEKRVWGGFAHMGKILECGGLCGVPKSRGAMSTMYHDGTFDVTPLDPDSRCTPISVAAHTLYEKSRPDILHGPGGYLDLSNMKTEALEDERSVRVSGGMYHFLKDEGLPYTLKLEGAEVVGYRAQTMGSFKDPILIGQLDNYLERVKEYVASQHEGTAGTWELNFHKYGQQQVSTSPGTEGQPSEIFLIGEALASSQKLATSVACVARIAATHGPYPGQKATSGNFAYGLGGQMETALGPCAQFSIYHLMQLREGEERLRLDSSSHGLFAQEIAVMGASESTVVGVFPPAFSIPAKAAKTDETTDISSEDQRRTKTEPRTLGDISRLLRSKNAGPFEVTLDVMFESEAEYKLVKGSNFLNIKSMAQLFRIRGEDVLWQGFFDQALAYKVTIPRTRNGKITASGGYMESDVHASQQYIGLMNMALSDDLVERWNKLQRREKCASL